MGAKDPKTPKAALDLALRHASEARESANAAAVFVCRTAELLAEQKDDCARLRAELTNLRIENLRLRDAISMLRNHVQIARIFVEGKALVPDPTVLMAFDHTLAETKDLERQ